MVLTLIGLRPDLEPIRDQILGSSSVPSLDDVFARLLLVPEIEANVLIAPIAINLATLVIVAINYMDGLLALPIWPSPLILYCLSLRAPPHLKHLRLLLPLLPSLGESGLVCRLRRSLYGLKQSPRAWFGRFSSVVQEFGMLRSTTDHSVFYHHNSLGQCIYLVVYMDDIVITGSDQDGIQKLKQHLFTHFQTKDLGKLKYFLGIEIAQSSSGVVLSQRKYALDILKETGMLDCKPLDTPMDPNVKLVPGQGEPLGDPGRYRRLVGKLNYLTITRPDISFPVSVVSQFLQSPCDSHWDVVIRILRLSMCIYLVVYMDDIVITSSDQDAQSSSGVVLSQRKYALDILKETGMLDCKPLDTPMDPNVKLVPGQGEPLGDPGRYRRLVGKLNYLTITRPDISFPVSVTPCQGVLYENRGHTQVVGYTDADWAGSPTDRRSTSGYCVFIGGNLISWKSKKQDVVARSSAEAEYQAMALATCELIWLRHLLQELRFGKG
ncbi:Retrovirus-related Pol polyprotein from transposon RE1 [Vitis vinifera]|uniref:Retrovirus-related Pol polyprotein from transposon RE1 n=1 Tax=Vitis vinifera TaxID=29760 RepID=A0A438GAX9_VITVI|nr:Retrovirus-related Pol polyprotein from transposon RE1 [Vitis vinifera]